MISDQSQTDIGKINAFKEWILALVKEEQAHEYHISDVANPIAELILAHGAGAACDSEFMLSMSDLLAANKIKVHRFNFSYIAYCRRK